MMRIRMMATAIMLGINGREIENGKPYEQINTVAVFDADSFGAKDSVEYVKVTLKLMRKQDESGYTNSPALPMLTYFKDLELLNKDEVLIAKHDPTAKQAENQKVLAANVTCDDTTNEYVYVIPRALLELQNDPNVYTLNIKAYSGSNTTFENNSDEHMYYSNYKIQVEMSLMEDADPNSTPLHEEKGAVIYTNARLISDMATPKTFTP